MPNRDVHISAGAVAGGAFAAYKAWGQPSQGVAVEIVGGIVGGMGGGLLPDFIDTPDSPHHRAEAHSLSITGTAGYYLNAQLPSWQWYLREHAQYFGQMRAASSDPLAQIGYGFLELFLRFLAGALAGLLAGYRTATGRAVLAMDSTGSAARALRISSW